MKSIVAVICAGAVILLTAGCKKHTHHPDLPTVRGSWELRVEEGGFAGTINYQPGNGNLVQFDDMTYKRYANGQLIKSGNYRVITDTSADRLMCHPESSGQFTDRIIYDNDITGTKYYSQVTGNQLILISSNCWPDVPSKFVYARQ